MKRHSIYGLFLIFLSVILTGISSAQAPPALGTPAFGSFGGGPFDTVNLGNLNVHFAVPIFHKAGRGLPFNYDLDYDGSVWYPVPVSGNLTWQPVANWGWKPSMFGTTGYITYTQTTVACYDGQGHQNGTTVTMSNWAYVEALGTVHGFTGQWVMYNGGCSGTSVTSFVSTATDSSGMTLYASTTTGTYIVTASGTVLYPPMNPNAAPAATTITDANGNQITSDSSGHFYDTLSSTTPVLTVTGSVPTVTLKYTAPNGSFATYTINYGTYNVRTRFGCSGVADPTINGVYLVSSITLPDNTSYSFTYEQTLGSGNSGYTTGRLQSVTLPTGGSITYTYSGGSGDTTHNAITCVDGSTAGLTRALIPGGSWKYSRTGSGNAWTTTVTDPATPGNQTVIYFQKDSATSNPTSNFYETQRIAYQGTAPTTPLATTITCYNAPSGTTPTPSGCPSAAVSTPILRTTAFNYLPSGVEAETDSTYDIFDLVHDVYNYDFVSGPTGPLLRHTSTSYFGGMTNGIVDRPYQVKVYDGGGTLDAQTTYNYDESTPATTSGTPQHTSITGSRGNLTTVAAQANSTTALYRKFTYYDTGMLNTSTDASTSNTTSGPTTTYNYASGTASCGNSFVTSITEPLSLSRSMTWNCTGGVTLTVIDENLNTTTTTYSDTAFWRPASTQFPDGGQTTTTYNLTQNPPNITASSKIDASRNLTSQTNLDGLGRTVRTELTSDPNGTVYTDTTYNNIGQVASVTNPYRSTSDPTYGVTQYAYDALGRTKSVIQPDSSTANISYAGNCGTVTDEAGKLRKSCSDGLGRMIQVFEDPNGLNYETDYAYDALNNLSSVNQKGDNSAPRTRAFQYDSLSRLTSAANPESGTISYAYDANGNLSSKVAPAPNQTGSSTVTTTYTYDALHRLTQKSYSDGTTPAVFFQYDGPNNGFGVPATNLVGRLDEEWTGTSCCGTTGEIFGYDPMGRIVMNEQYTANMSYHPVNYTYDLAGDLTSGSNGEGVTLSYNYDSATRPTQVTSNFVDSQHPAQLAAVNWYTPSGFPEYATFGNGAVEVRELNNRLQPCRFNLNSGPNPPSVLPQHCGDNLQQSGISIQDFYLTYNEGSADNGDVAMWQGTFGQTFHRNFGYDGLNRLASMSDSNTVAPCLGLSWNYDAWGNRTAQTGTRGNCYNFNAAATVQNRLAGYQYDAAGNMTYDGTHHYTYDAENRLTQVDGGATASYVYDAEGRRAEKNTGGWSDYIHDLGGRPVAQVGVNGWQIGYVYLNGSLLAQYQNSTTYFAHSDHLGSARVMTAEGPSTRIQSSGGTSLWKYYISGVCPTVSGVTYTVSVMVKNQGTAAVQIGGNIVNGPVIAAGVTQQVSFTEAGNGTSCAQLAFVTLHTGDSIDVLAFAPSITASTAPGTNLIASGNQNFSGWAAYYGSSVTLTQAQPPLVLDSLDYQPYGEQIAGDTGTPLKFTGDEHDNESNLEHTLFRQYASRQGRWTVPDPAGLAAVDPTNPQTWNRYAYVANNPLNATDPLGLDGGCNPLTDPTLCGSYCPPGASACGDPCVENPLACDGPEVVITIFAPPPTPDQLPRVGGRYGDVNNETLGLPPGINLKALTLGDLFGLNPNGPCDFGVCAPAGGDNFNSATWETGLPTVTRICVAVPGCVEIAVGVLAAVTLLIQTGDGPPRKTPEQCDKRFQKEKDFCSKKYWGTPLYGACRDRAFWRYSNCLKGEGDPGPLDPKTW